MQNMNRKPKLVVVSGAGLSASAGIATYSDIDSDSSSKSKQRGLWSIHKMESICVKGNEFSDESIDFYNNFHALEAATKPSSVHALFARLQARYGVDRIKLHTQNIDTLLERAGCAAVHHVHGNISEHKCANCGTVIHEGLEQKVGMTDRGFGKKCCLEQKLRRNVVFYGERGYYTEMIDDLLDLEQDDVFMLIGTSCKAINPDLYVRSIKCRKIYVNLAIEKEVNVSKYEKVILGKAEDHLEEIDAFVCGALRSP